jgi:hypothetical protein
MLRAFVLILLLANLAFFAWAQGWLRVLDLDPSPQSEPYRLSQQIRPEALRVVPEAPGRPPAEPDAAAAPVPSGQ